MQYAIRYTRNGQMCPEGPWDSRAEAQRFLDAEVGVPAEVVEIGAAPGADKSLVVGHRFGGTITPTHVGHKTDSRVAYWFIRGDVKWIDGTESAGAEITPNNLCVPDLYDDVSGRQQLNAVLDAINAYLADAGEWLREPKRIRGMVVHWVPREKNGEVPLLVSGQWPSNCPLSSSVSNPKE